MPKRVALIGHCGPDSSYLKMAVSAAERGTQVIACDDDGELQELIKNGIDLLLFNRILDFVAQLESVAVPADPPAPVVGPPRTPLREDVVTAVPLTRSPGDAAPEFRAGFFLVPRRGTMGES